MNELMTNGSHDPTQLTDKKNKKLPKKSKKSKKIKKTKAKQDSVIPLNPKILESVVETTEESSGKISKKLYENRVFVEYGFPLLWRL